MRKGFYEPFPPPAGASRSKPIPGTACSRLREETRVRKQEAAQRLLIGAGLVSVSRLGTAQGRMEVRQTFSPHRGVENFLAHTHRVAFRLKGILLLRHGRGRCTNDSSLQRPNAV